MPGESGEVGGTIQEAGDVPGWRRRLGEGHLRGRQESITIAQDIETILARGSMVVKAFTFSGTEPDEKVSADSVHVSLAGYLWSPVEDLMKLDIGLHRLAKARRSKRPAPITRGTLLKLCIAALYAEH
jgi:hypothetical protein